MNPGVFAAVFAALYAGHQLGDYVLGQTDHAAAHKADPIVWRTTGTAKRDLRAVRAMGSHLLGYGTCQVVALGILAALTSGLTLVGVAAGMAVSLGTHGLIDRRWPIRWLLNRTGMPQFATVAGGGVNGMHLADQATHVGCLFLAAVTVAVLSG